MERTAPKGQDESKSAVSKDALADGVLLDGAAPDPAELIPYPRRGTMSREQLNDALRAISSQRE